MNTRNSKGVISALPASWEGIGYLMQGDRVDERGKGGVGHRNSLSLDEIRQTKLLLHVRILRPILPSAVWADRFNTRCLLITRGIVEWSCLTQIDGSRMLCICTSPFPACLKIPYSKKISRYNDSESLCAIPLSETADARRRPLSRPGDERRQ
ncbi:hypothetical protein EVAR_99309_1 [Eumeta japonica]|uniref:Uncharacterized protein n=1 Tax=Eumeta variegata TaxID=151549 RepID=A0A4C1YU40_EUMVA|nr:hypothetical protein EVAR_99309_1 [Eumeta japonica]